MNDTALKRILGSIAAEAIPPDEIDLWPSISNSLPATSSHSTHKRGLMKSRVAIAALLAVGILIISLLVIGPERALAALRGFFGYMPGIGFVEDFRSILDEPVIVEQGTPTAPEREWPSGSTGIAIPSGQEREGITVTIQEAVVETGRTVLVYRVTGLPPNLIGPDREPQSTAPDGEAEADHLSLADGSILHMIEGRYQYGSDTQRSVISARLVFPALPEGENEFFLVIPRFEYVLPGELPENWSIPIRLMPVEPAQVMAGIERPNLASPAIQGIILRLIRVAQTPNETAFQLALEWEGSERFVHHTAPVTLRDPDGRYYILTTGPEAGEYTSDNPNFSTLPSYVTTAIRSDDPLTLSLEWVMMSATGQASFTFDPGRNLQIGQEWSLDEELLVGGYSLRVTAGRLKRGENGQVVLEFDLEAPAGIIGVSIYPVTNAGSSGESGWDRGRNTLVARSTLPSFPTGPVELQVMEVRYRVDGPWQITWQPQAIDLSGFAAATPAPILLPGPTPTFVPQQPLLPEIAALLDKAYGPYQREPGWVHMVVEVRSAGDVGVLDTGDVPPQPLEYISESWMYLDREGRVRISVVQIKSLDGLPISTYLTNDTAHLNLPEGRGGFGDLYLAPPAYDNELLSILNWHFSEGRTVERVEAVLEGRRTWLLTVAQEYEPPQVYQGEPAPVWKSEYRVWVDQETGRLLQSQNVMFYVDRESRVTDTTIFRQPERVESPPPEVLQLLDQMILP
jgi:hypothetical protein